MQSSTKIAMKERTRRYTSTANTFTPQEQTTSAEFLTHKTAFLEDMVRLYQTELDFHLSSKKAGLKGVGSGPLGMGVTDADLSRMTDSNVGQARQLRILNDEIAALRKEKEMAVAACTADFHKAIQRNNERQYQVSKAMLQENDALKAKITSLEAEQREKRSLDTAGHAVDIMDLKYRIEEQEAQLHDTEKDVENERFMRVSLEETLVDAKQELFDMEEFVSGFDAVAEDILQQIGRQRNHHGQLVNTLLQSSALVTREQGLKAGEVNVSKEEELSDGLRATDDELMQMNLIALGSNPTERLQKMLLKLETISEAQQVELALAVRCALDSFDAALKESGVKLNDSYAHCELQVRRIEDLEREYAEQRDHSFQERDKAMNQRDQALLQLRSRQDTKDHRFLKHQETQTIFRGSLGGQFGQAGGAGATASSGAPTSGPAATGGAAAGTSS